MRILAKVIAMAGGEAAGAKRRRLSRFQISYSVPTHGPEGPIMKGKHPHLDPHQASKRKMEQRTKASEPGPKVGAM